MPRSKKPGLTAGTKFKQAGKFLAEAKAARKKQSLVDYGHLFSTVAGANAGTKTLQVSLKSSSWAQKLASGSAGKAKAAGPLAGGGLIKIHGVTLKPGLADILRYNTKRAGKGSAYSYALEGSKVAMHAPPGAGMSVGATGGAGKLLLRQVTGKAVSKKKDTVIVKTARVSAVTVVGAKAAAKVAPKECTCVLTSAGASQAYPNTTQDECRAAATLYGFAWKWECAT